ENEFAGNYIEDLSINRLIKIICPSENIADYITQVLSKPLIYKENIIYRKELINEFIENNGLIDELFKVLTEYDEIKKLKKSQNADLFL
ncbi:MAG: hypothetical protein K0S55_1970, partial [Clostridia bacterium]|nr:hypothetical protein [Clostridia bacterium]